MWRATGVAIALGCVALISGCTGGKSHPTGSSAPASRSSSRASSAGAALPSGVVGATAVPTAVPNKPALRTKVAINACAAAAGGWAASGTARNPGKTSTTYRITVFFTTKNATVIGTAATKVHVPSGATRRWRADAKFTAANPTQCVLRGVG